MISLLKGKDRMSIADDEKPETNKTPIISNRQPKSSSQYLFRL